MQTKYYLHDLSDKNKRHFYSQEIFEDSAHVKVRLILVVIVMTVCDLGFARIIHPLIDGRPIPPIFTLDLLALVLGISIYSLSLSRFLQKKTPKMIKLRRILNTLATLMTVVYVFYVQYDRVLQALTTTQEKEWMRAYVTLSQSIYTLLSILLLTPLWYFKALVGLGYYTGIASAFLTKGHSEENWILIKCIMSGVYVIVLLYINAQFRWNLFLKRLDIEAWNQVYTDILNRNPSSIAVIKEKGKIIYSNAEFQKTVNNEPENFFKSITNLRSRCNLFELKNIGICSMSVINFEESKDLLQKDDTLGKSAIYPKQNRPLNSSIRNLSDLINYYLSLVENHQVNSTDQVVFDGKLTDESNLDATLSYEIIIRPLVEYKKIIIILNDTTERDLVVALENNNEYKDQLLASVSHELRTPLNGSLGCLQAAIDDQSVPSFVRNKFLVPALRSSRLLSYLINDILDYSQLQTDKIAFIYETKPLRETIEHCCQLFEHAFSTKELSFKLMIDESLPPLFKTDHGRLSQVILNLLSNALKFTMEGSVSIEASNLDGNAEIRVKDTGIGINPKEIPRLFGENLLTYKELSINKYGKGAGLGLKISNRLAKLLSPGGTDIQVESVVDEGSSFYFIVENRYDVPNIQELNTLSSKKLKERDIEAIDMEEASLSVVDIPLEFLLEADKITKNSIPSYCRVKQTYSGLKTSNFSPRLSISSPRGIIKKCCILIVDDDPFNIIALKSMLNSYEVSIESATNGKQAIEKVTANPEQYKLIFMDCQMPIMNGFEASRILSTKMQEGKLPIIPIIGCTAFSAKDKIKQCFRCGMREVINKPVIINKLKDIIKEYL